MTSEPESHLRFAWSLFKRHWRPFLLAELTIAGAWVILEVAVVAAHRTSMPAVMDAVVWLCLHLAFFLVFCALMAGIHVMALQSVDGGVPTFTIDLIRLDRGQSYLTAALLYWAAVLLGLCLVVVPGLIVAVRWGLFRFVVAGGPQPAVSSLREADLLSASRRWLLFRVFAVSAALNLAGAALLGLGLLVAFPVTVLYRASHFRALQRHVATTEKADAVL